MSVNIVIALVKHAQSQPATCSEHNDGSTAGHKATTSTTNTSPGLDSSRSPDVNASGNAIPGPSPGAGAVAVSVERPLEVAYVCVLGAMQVG